MSSTLSRVSPVLNSATRPHPTGFVLRHLLICVALMAAGTVWSQTSATAQPVYPSKPVRLVVSYAAGNVTDLLARIIGQKLVENWGQQVIVDNRPALGGSAGAQIVARAPADGYTLVFSAMAAMAINPHLYPNVGYDVIKDFAPIINVAFPASVMVVNSSLNIGSFKELVEYSKANPTALNYGTAGNGTVPHLNIEVLKLRTGLIAQHVPYKAAAAVLADLVAGRIQIQLQALSVLLSQIKANRVIPIAASTPRRLPQLPNTPTLSELVPGYVPAVPWLGILAPAGTPAAIVAKVNHDVAKILQLPDIQEKLAANGLTITGDSPDAFAKAVTNDYERFGELVKQLAIKVD